GFAGPRQSVEGGKNDARVKGRPHILPGIDQRFQPSHSASHSPAPDIPLSALGRKKPMCPLLQLQQLQFATNVANRNSHPARSTPLTSNSTGKSPSISIPSSGRWLTLPKSSRPICSPCST